MSSLAAARADNFYHPPDFDPAKHGSLNKYHGQHALRDRARKLESEGVLIIRFEVPFNIWCSQCGEHIAKGVRFNAEKKQVGTYFSTKVWSFAMRHHCGCRIVIQTDPKAAEYVVTDGARRKVEAYDAGDAQTIELPDGDERAAIAADPLASLERSTLSAARAASARGELVALAAEREAKGRDPYALNKQLRAVMRTHKKTEAGLDTERRALGLPEHVKLLPASAADAEAAQLALFQASDSKFEASHRGKRQKIMTESIFGAAEPPGQQQRQHQQQRPRSTAAAAAGGGGGGSSSGSRRPPLPLAAAARVSNAKRQSAKEQLQQRVLLSKQKRRAGDAFG